MNNVIELLLSSLGRMVVHPFASIRNIDLVWLWEAKVPARVVIHRGIDLDDSRVDMLCKERFNSYTYTKATVKSQLMNITRIASMLT
jgi:hypothetical protein